MFKFNDKIEFYSKKNNVMAVGELLIDMIAETSGSNKYHSFFGGSPANIAINVKKLGISSIVASAVGNDRLGDFLIDSIRSAGIDTGCVQQVDYATSMVLINQSKTAPVPIFYRGADCQMEYTPEIEAAVGCSNILHFSCWAISKQPVRKTMEKIIDTARKQKVLICFDPNYHPMIWNKEENGVEYIKSIIRHVDIVKPSEDDAARLFGEDSNENQIKKFLQLGVRLVVMTLGSEGAIASNGKETVRFKTMASDIVDTTGAGDAFWSGFYAAIVKGYPVRKALELGFAVSAYKLRYLGAVVNLPELEEIRVLFHL